MALIKCPECGKEDVSSSALICPNCGYDIQTYRKQLEDEQEQKQKRFEEQCRQEDLEWEKKREQLIKQVPKPKEPVKWTILDKFKYAILLSPLLGAAIWTFVDPYDLDWWIFGIFILIFWFITTFPILFMGQSYTDELKKYNEIMADFDSYASKIVDEQHEEKVMEREMRHAIEMQQFDPPVQDHTVTCPYCGSHNCKKIGVGGRAVSVGMTGLASSKIGKQWHCNNCNSDF